MENFSIVKMVIVSILGVIGSFVTELLGGWDTALKTLVICMAIDYATGLIVAGIFKASKKSESGTLQSGAGFKGICRKGTTLLIILIAFRLDLTIGSTFIRNAVIIGYIINEVLSIVENAGLMGLPIPDALKNGIDALATKNEIKKGE